MILILVLFRDAEVLRGYVFCFGRSWWITNELRVARHLSQDESCQRFDADTENLDRIFRRCPISRAIWYMLLPQTMHSEFLVQDSNLWMLSNLKNEESVNGKQWYHIFALAVVIYGSVETYLFFRSTRFNLLVWFLRYGEKRMLFQIVFSILIPYIRSLWVLKRVQVFVGSTLQMVIAN